MLPERQRELVATSLIGVEQLTETVHEFLDLTRIEAGELRLNLEPVHVSAVIADALRRIEGQAKAQGISLVAHLDTDLAPISADPLRLRAVFDNILSNALKYTPEGGRVTVESHRTRRVSRGRIADGVHQRRRHGSRHPRRVPFASVRQVFPTRTPSERPTPGARGAGIGLYMCRQIVELHGGEISCSTGPDGQGTRIAIRLPARSEGVAAVLTGSTTYGTSQESTR